jgi:PIN domain nuclease of toxin-antitoxin system
MVTKHILDTHALIWHLEGNPRLGLNARAVIDDPQSELVLPVIVLAEAFHLIAKGRTSIPTPQHLIGDISVDPRLVVYPLTYEILLESLALNTIPEMHDRLIAATAVFLGKTGTDVRIVTKDRSIVDAGAVSVIWS